MTLLAALVITLNCIQVSARPLIYKCVDEDAICYITETSISCVKKD